MADNMIGKVFSGRYKLTERIGTGGMAEVYRADDTVLGRVVAVKVMLPQYAADKEFTDRFRQEAASAANLQNPYIVNIYDWGQDGNDYFIVMEYVRGSDLKSGIKSRGALQQRKVAEIAMQVCQALTTAHSQDIMHRDIKPQNIMVQPDGNVKVMDFGIARAKNSLKTQTSSVLGTAHYISPEQAQGKDVTQASDIYSLGIVMYEAATGQLPFDGPDAVSVAMKQVNEKPQAPRAIKPDIDPDLEKIIGKAMNKDPQKRFSTAKDMQDCLNDYLAGRPVNLNNSAAKTAVIAGGAAIAGAAVAGAAMAAGAEPDKTGVMPADAVNKAAKQNRDFKQQAGKKGKSGKKSSSKKKKVIIGVVVAILIAAGIGAFILFGLGDPVPDVVGMKLDDAKAKIEDEGFSVGNIEKRHDPDVEEDKVISQDPDSMFKKPKGSPIDLVVSLGPEIAKVPDVLGKSRQEAQTALESAGFKVVFGEDQYSTKYDIGTVMAQDPVGGTNAPKDSVITIVISKGTESVAVPNVVNYSESDAINTLKSAGFAVNVTREYSDKVDEGIVMSQSPSGNNKAEKGSTVTITVSRGSNNISVPDVVGKSVSEAKAILQNAGFNVSVSGAGDKVISMSPVGGNKVPKGSTITIFVG